MELLWLIVKWLGLSVIAVAGGFYDYKAQEKRKKKMRKFDTYTQDVKDDILETFCEYAKKDIEDGNFETGETVVSIATLYGWAFLLVEADFSNVDLVPLVSWHGTKPPRPPRP